MHLPVHLGHPNNVLLEIWAVAETTGGGKYYYHGAIPQEATGCSNT